MVILLQRTAHLFNRDCERGYKWAPPSLKKEKQKPVLILYTEGKDMYSHSAFMGVRRRGEHLLY